MTAAAERRRIQRFEVIAHLGAGGMGTVYRARDPQLERDVAIKVLTDAGGAPELSPDDTMDLRVGASPGTRDDLLREARMMAQLSHPNVLPVYEAGLADGAVFVVMELIDGCDLGAWLSETRTTAQILDVFAQAGRGLAAAHARGIVHRDFKPANVLIGSDGRARVADFGLSKLTARSSTSMVHIDDGKGTPRYMAPELLQGGPATAASDVYAFCVALDEAFGRELSESADQREQRWRERGVPPELRVVLAAGLSDVPAGRPALAAILAALQPRPRRRHVRWVMLGAAVAVVGATVVMAVATRDDEIACELDASELARVWNPERRGHVRDKLLAAAEPDTRDDVEATLANLDEDRALIEEHRKRLCDDLRARKITQAQATLRRSCLDRRVFELDAQIERFTIATYDARKARSRTQTFAAVSDCIGMTASPLPADPSGVRDLYRRFAASHELAVPTKAKQHLAELQAVEADAMRSGETELAARAAYQQSFEYRFQDDHAAAEQALARVYRVATDIDAPMLAVDAMIERTFVAAFRNDHKAARGYADRASELADRPATPLAVRARLHAVRGRALYMAGEYKAAIPELERGLELQRQSGKRSSRFEIDMRIVLIESLRLTEGRAHDAVKVGRDSLHVAGELVGEDSANYGVMLNTLASALAAVDDHAGAREHRRQALANMRANMPADSAVIATLRMDILPDMLFAGEYEAAHAEATALLDEAERNKSLKEHQGRIVQHAAIASFHLGRTAEGMQLLAQARDESTSQLGLDHKNTLYVRRLQLELEIELGRTDAAERTFAALEKAVGATPDESKQTLAYLRGVHGARLAVARGRYAEAERLARDALLLWAELKGRRLRRIELLMALAEALAGQRRWQDARPVVDEALQLARELALPPHLTAMVEIRGARVDAGLGREGAFERARAARAVLDKFPGYIHARREADQLIATQPTGGR